MMTGMRKSSSSSVFNIFVTGNSNVPYFPHYHPHLDMTRTPFNHKLFEEKSHGSYAEKYGKAGDLCC
jgi:hypothetical protein